MITLHLSHPPSLCCSEVIQSERMTLPPPASLCVNAVIIGRLAREQLGLCLHAILQDHAEAANRIKYLAFSIQSPHLRTFAYEVSRRREADVTRRYLSSVSSRYCVIARRNNNFTTFYVDAPAFNLKTRVPLHTGCAAHELLRKETV
eukprot:GHVU01103868.1.p1 GENE.GHVU01103868.1~~GHVU01103868.1.p1  ORF type:complete len:147 (+),score=5.38 GHVU01103868.1:671-1111(+)